MKAGRLGEKVEEASDGSSHGGESAVGKAWPAVLEFAGTRNGASTATANITITILQAGLSKLEPSLRIMLSWRGVSGPKLSPRA